MKRLLLGNRRTIAGTVYGTIIAMSVLAAAARRFEHMLWRLDALLAITALVLWLAHVYAHGLGESLNVGRRLTFRELVSVARREYPIVTAAVAPVVAVALGAVGLLAGRTAVALALGVGVATLTAQGVRYAALENLSPLGTAITVSINAAIGLTLVAAEVWISH